MMFPGWQVGLDIQADGVRAAAVQWHRQGWQLRHWWFLPFPERQLTQSILPEPNALRETLSAWRNTLPRRHHLRVGFPAQRTLQRQVPLPTHRLQASAQEKYIAGATARQLQIPAAQLCYGYADDGDPLCVTAARLQEVNTLLSCLASASLYPKTVAPADKALSALPESCYPAACRFLVHEEADYWLWAQPQASGRSGWLDKRQVTDFSLLCRQLDASPREIAFSHACGAGVVPGEAKMLNAWKPLVRHQPPLPVHGGLYTLALGLAFGKSS